MSSEKFDYIVPGYSQGYTRALLDVLITIQSIDESLTTFHRRRNKKTYEAIVQCMIDNRQLLRENPYAFVRCSNKSESGFEVFVKKENELSEILNKAE